MQEPAPVRQPEPAPLEVAAPAAEVSTNPVVPVRKPAEQLFPCRRCGQLVRRQRECPVCDAAGEALLPVDPEEGPRPEQTPAPLRGLAAPSLELDEPEPAPAAPEEEGPDPYLMADRDLPHCPRCRKEMAVGGVVCTSCGFNRETRKKAVRTYQPLARSWESDMTLRTRLGWMAAFQGFHLILTCMASLQSFAWPFLVAWLPLTLILCFVLGTFDRIDLTRDTRGRVTITKHWRFCFVPVPPRVIEVRGFEGVVTGQWNDTGLFEWIVFLNLLCVGIIPAFIWWYNAIMKNYYHVALAIDHGHAEVFVYRGRSDEQMNEIARAVCEATGLRNIT